MKRIIVAFICCFISNFAHAQSGYDITINLKNCKDSIAYLTYYQFDKTYLKDTCTTVKNGKIIFNGKTKLEKGIYSLVSQQKSIVFDFFIDDQNQKLEFKNDSESTTIEGLEVLNSPIQNNFINYLKFVNKQNADFIAYKNSLTIKTKKDTLTLQEKQKEFDQKIIDYEHDFYDKHKSTFIGDVMNLKMEKVLKDIPKASNGRPDSLYVYKYYKKHYWDNVDFKDDGIVRNPFFHNEVC